MLLNLDNSWNKEMIRDTFVGLDAELICSILLAVKGAVDRIIWHNDKKGTFSVKNGYKLFLSKRWRELPSSLNLNSSWWKAMWKLKIPNKLNIFLLMVC